MKHTIFFLSLLLVCSFAQGIVAEAINEDVDLSNFKYVYTSVTYKLPPEYLGRLTLKTLEDKCKTLYSITSCVPVIEKNQNKVIFKIFESNIINLNKVNVDEKKDLILLNFSFQYTPKQFFLSSGFDVKKRELKLIYPTYSTIVENFQEVFVISSFRMKFNDILEFETPIDSIKATVGDPIRIRSLHDLYPNSDMCIGALVINNKVVQSEMSLGCESFSLMTSGLSPSSNYKLYVLKIEDKGIKKRVVPVVLSKPELSVSIYSKDKEIVLGDTFEIDVSSNKKIDSCTINILDRDGNIQDTMDFSSCGHIPLGTSTQWGSGKHIIEVNAVSGKLKGKGAIHMNFIMVGLSPSTIKVDKSEYSAGEEISIFPDINSEYCVVEILDSNYIKISETESPRCDTVKMELDESLKEGNYIIKSTAYNQGVAISKATRTVQIKPWSPVAGTTSAELCKRGMLNVDDYSIPCLSPNQLCLPSTTSIPICLCFNGDGEPVDVCEFKGTCGETECAEPKQESPFIVVIENGQCRAKKGMTTLDCIHFSEISLGDAICLDDKDRPIQSCAAGQMCSPSGCISSELEFELRYLSQYYLREDELAKRKELTWVGSIRVEKGVFLTDEHKNALSFSSSLEGASGDFKNAVFNHAKNQWEITFLYSGALAPGNYNMYLEVTYKEKTHLVRQHFEIWHNSKNKKMTVNIFSVNPAHFSFSELEHGASTKVKARIREHNGRLVTSLPSSAVSLRFGNVKAKSVIAQYDKVAQLWDIVGNFKEKKPQESSEILLDINNLGQSGRATKGFDVVKSKQLSATIRRINPGTLENPLFYLLITLGFEMDIFVKVESEGDLTKENFAVKLGNFDITPNIQYIETTLEGIRIHLSQVRLCPDPPQPDTQIRLELTVKTNSELVTDSTYLDVVGNPGNWNNRQQVAC